MSKNNTPVAVHRASPIAGMAAVWLLALLGGCATPSGKFPMSTMPDFACQSEGVFVTDVYIWECVKGEHIVVSKKCGQFSCMPPTKDTVACGKKTPVEMEFGIDHAISRACTGTPEVWQVQSSQR